VVYQLKLASGTGYQVVGSFSMMANFFTNWQTCPTVERAITMTNKSDPRVTSEQMTFAQLHEFYIDQLFNQIMPFWMNHCIDVEYGGINNIVADDGTVLSTDKMMWSQGRALWTFSALYNYFEHDQKWLDVADGIARLLIRYGRDEKGAWVFKLHQDGRVAEPYKSIYVDGFVIYGLTEYARATGNQEALDIAIDSYQRTSPLLLDHANLPTQPHPIPDGFQAHGPIMLFSSIYHDLGLLANNQAILDRALELAETVMTQHVRIEEGILHEFVRPGGGLDDTDQCQTFIPGHTIESMWFFERVYQHHGRQDRIAQTMKLIKSSLEKGWDEQYGGLFLACHTAGGTPQWHQPDAKSWWTASESFYALLRAFEVTGEPWCLDWYGRMHDYAFSVFPNREHGEWFQTLERQGNPVPNVIKGFNVKDPFHLPRALIYSIPTLSRLAAE